MAPFSLVGTIPEGNKVHVNPIGVSAQERGSMNASNADNDRQSFIWVAGNYQTPQQRDPDA